jgi:hypothetical protein
VRKASKPAFSLLHPTARFPAGWQSAARTWMERADNPLHVEHILCVDDCDIHKLPLTERTLTDRLVINKGRRCSTDAYNRAGESAHGDVLIVIADDFFPCPHWDSLLLNVIPDVKKQHVVWVATGGNSDLLTQPIFTRAFYEKYRYVFWHEYSAMFADNDFHERAKKDGVIIDCRATLPEFPHMHPAYGRGVEDDVYRHENKPENYELGRAIFERRKASNFA